MFQSISLLTRWVRRGVESCQRRRVSFRLSRLWQALGGPLQVGVSLQPGAWHVVLHEPGVPGLQAARGPSAAPARTVEQSRVWSPGTLPELWALLPGRPPGSVPADHQAAWRMAVQTLRELVPTGTCHLTLAWPDDLLWSGAVTLSGPLSKAELPALLAQELSLVLPVPIDQVSWDARPLGLSAEAPSVRGGWRAMLSWLRAGHPWASIERSDHEVAWQCWAMPRALAQHIRTVGWQVGWASVSIEPRSLAEQRVTERWPVTADTLIPDPSMRVNPSPEALAARGAALRESQDRPDLLRGLSGGGWGRYAQRARGGWPWWLAWGLIAGAGYALGGLHQQRWAQEHEAWTQRLKQLQATLRDHQERRQANQQVRRRQQEQEEREAYNQRFAQVLQAWASTVPAGVRWQQLSMRPQLIELQAQAMGAEGFTRWMDQWPQALPAGGQHHLHWQPQAPSAPSVPSPPLLGVRVQVSWNPSQKALE